MYTHSCTLCKCRYMLSCSVSTYVCVWMYTLSVLFFGLIITLSIIVCDYGFAYYWWSCRALQICSVKGHACTCMYIHVHARVHNALLCVEMGNTAAGTYYDCTWPRVDQGIDLLSMWLGTYLVQCVLMFVCVLKWGIFSKEWFLVLICSFRQ